MSKWYYVVLKGITPGVYENWEVNDEWCCPEEWCRHKKFRTLQEATAKFNESLRPNTAEKEPTTHPGAVDPDQTVTTTTAKRPRANSK